MGRSIKRLIYGWIVQTQEGMKGPYTSYVLNNMPSYHNDIMKYGLIENLYQGPAALSNRIYTIALFLLYWKIPHSQYYNQYCIKHCNEYINSHYSTGVQIVNCTLSSDSVLSDSTGLFNPVLSVWANEIAFDKKLANQSVFQMMLGLEEHYSPPPLGDFSRLFLKAWNIIQIMTFKCDLFFKCN